MSDAPTIGIETRGQRKTKTTIFCGCANEFGALSTSLPRRIERGSLAP